MTSRLWLLAIIIYAFLLAGLLSFNGGEVAMLLPLVIYLTAALIHMPRLPEVVVTRTFNTGYVTQGSLVKVHLDILNSGPMLEEVCIEDILPPDMEVVEGEPSLVIAIPNGGRVELEYTIRARRGSYTFDAIKITNTGAFGLFRHKVKIPAHGHIWMMPEYIPLQRLAIRPLRTHGFSGPIPSRKAGSGVNFLGLRDYQPGDPLRAINWRVSARHMQDLFTNEFEMDRIADIGIILDARHQNDFHTSAGSLFEYMVRAAAGLADACLADGHRVGLLVYGRGLEFTFAGYGKIQRQRIFQALARARTGSSYAFEKLDYLPTRFFPAHSQIILVSPLIHEDLQVITRLRANRYDVMIVCPDEVAFEASSLPPGLHVDLAGRISRLERMLVLKGARRLGCQVVDWRVDRSLDSALQDTLNTQARWLRRFGMMK